MPEYSKICVKTPLRAKVLLAIIAITGFVVYILFFEIALTTRPVVQAQTTTIPNSNPSTPATTPSANNDQVSRADLLLLQAQIQNLAQQLKQAQQDALESKNSARTAATLSIFGTFFGILGSVLGMLAILILVSLVIFRSRPGRNKDKPDKGGVG